MSLFVVDVEADGPYPGDYSMVCFGAVMVTPRLDREFYGETAPISNRYISEALAISGFTREEHERFVDPLVTIPKFIDWVNKTTIGHPIFISDNLAFDWMFTCYYCHKYGGRNPFGFSGRRIGDIHAGLCKDMRAKWKHLRKTKHDHNPVNDAKGNAEAILYMNEHMGLKL